MITCEVCGKKFEIPRYSTVEVCGSDCFQTKHWLNIKEDMGRNTCRYAVINREVYFIGDENANWKGYGGMKFTIRFLQTGNEITTTNLWHNGSVREIKDPELRAFFKNNAEFI